MFLKGEEIDALPIPFYKPVSSGMITSLKQELEERNEDIIDLSGEEPQFAIDHVPSRLNFLVEMGKLNTKKLDN